MFVIRRFFLKCCSDSPELIKCKVVVPQSSVILPPPKLSRVSPSPPLLSLDPPNVPPLIENGYIQHPHRQSFLQRHTTQLFTQGRSIPSLKRGSGDNYVPQMKTIVPRVHPVVPIRKSKTVENLSSQSRETRSTSF